MKILQVVPKAKSKAKLKALLKAKERALRGTATTFVRQREALADAARLQVDSTGSPLAHRVML